MGTPNRRGTNRGGRYGFTQTVMLGVVCGAVGSNKAVAILYNPFVASPGKVPFPQMGLVSLEVILTTAVASTFALGTPDDIGTVATEETGIVASWNSGTDLNGGAWGNGVGKIIKTWTVQPTLATVKNYSKVILPATIGASYEWKWDEENPLTTALNNNGVVYERGVVLQNIGVGASAAVLVNAKWLEY